MLYERIIPIVFSVLLVAALTGCNSSDGPASKTAAGDAAVESDDQSAVPGAEIVDSLYPRPIMMVNPKPGSEICLPASIDVRFELNNAMVVNGRHDPTAFDLFMDGRSVLRETEFFPSQSFPQTHLALLHAMWVYDPGPHTARVEFVGSDGDTHYEWQFTVKEGCPKPNL